MNTTVLYRDNNGDLLAETRISLMLNKMENNGFIHNEVVKKHLPENGKLWRADIQRRTVDRQLRHNRRESVKSFLALFSDDTTKSIAQAMQFRKLADGSYYLDRVISCSYILISKNPSRYNTLDYAFRSVLSALKRMKSQGNFLLLDNIEYLENQQVETRHKNCKVLLSGLSADYANDIADIDDNVTLDGMASARQHVKTWLNNVFITRLSNIEKARLADIMSVRYKTFKLFYNSLSAAKKQFFKRLHTKHFKNDNNVTYITLAEVLYNNY
jgi:hypothetical protein